VLVGRPGQDALITGDMIHSPIQGKYPELGMRADYDSRAAGQTRRQVFAACGAGATATNSSRERSAT